MTSPTPSICVAICTHDRPDFLAIALDSVVRQSRAPDRVLVVDNAPSNELTREIVEQRYPNVRYVRETTPGLNFARNRAVQECGCEVIAFLDDDAIADQEWIDRIAHVFEGHSDIAICTGRVLPLALETPAQKMFEAQGGFDRGERPLVLPADRKSLRMHGLPAPLIAWSIAIGVGANMALRVSLLDEIGPFDTALDLGAVLPGGGDVDIIWRALAADSQVRYEPEAIVRHAHRREMAGVEAQILGHRRAEIAFLCKSARNAAGSQSLLIRLFIAWRLAKPGWRLVKRATLRKDPLSVRLLLRLWRDMIRGLTAYSDAVGIAAEREALSAPGGGSWTG